MSRGTSKERELMNSQIKRDSSLNSSIQKGNTSQASYQKKQQKIVLQDIDKESDSFQEQTNSARSSRYDSYPSFVIILKSNNNENIKNEYLNDQNNSKFQKENIPNQYANPSSNQGNKILYKNRNSSTVDLALFSKQLQQQNLEKSFVSTQSLETNQIFSLDHVLPSSNIETNRFIATDFVELNQINKDVLLKEFKNMKQIKERYEDNVFKADEIALVNHQKNSKYKQWAQDFLWKRIKDFYPKYKYQLLSSLSCQTLIKPGFIEIPYLITALNVLKDYPNRVMNLVENQTLNDTCLYYVRICIDGVWKYIVIDDYVPCLRRNKASKIELSFIDLSPISLQSHDIWPLIILKAYAKYLGTYEVLLQGNVEETLRDFTGAPIQIVSTSEQYLIQIIIQALDRKNIVLVKPYQDLDEDTISNVGVQTENSYLITNILHLYGEAVIEIKDYYGTCIWNDKTLFRNYKEEDLRVLQIGMKQNVFYMKQSDFQRIFGAVSICKCNESYYYNAIRIRHIRDKYSIKKFVLKQTSQCHLELTQKDERLYRNQQHNYLQARMLVLKKHDRNNFELIDGVWGQKRNISIELNIDEGEYYVACLVEYEREIIDTVLSYYGEKFIQWEKVNYQKEPLVLENSLKQLCQEHAEKRMLNQNVYLYQILDQKVGLLTQLYENTSSYNSQNVQVESQFDDDKLVALKGPSSKDIILKPLYNDVFIWKTKHFISV